jgi:hypothetical protein
LKNSEHFTKFCKMSTITIEEFEELQRGAEITGNSTITQVNATTIPILLGLIRRQSRSIQNLQDQLGRIKSIEDEDEEDIVELKKFCDLCNDKHIAAYHCQNCSENLCDTAAAFHIRSKASKGHLVIELSGLKKIPDQLVEHDVNIYRELAEWKTSSNQGDASISIENLYGIEFTRRGEVLLLDHTSVPKFFSKTGNFLRRIEGNGKIYQNIPALGIRLDIQNIIFTCSDWRNHIYSSDGVFKHTIGIPQPSEHTQNIEYGVITDDKVFKFENNVYNRVVVFSKNSIKITSFSIDIQTDTEASHCTRIELSPSGDLFMADIHNNVVKVFSQEGKSVRVIGNTSGVKYFNFDRNYPNTVNIKFSDKSEVFILDRNSIKVFTEDGRFLYKVCQYSLNTIRWFSVCSSTGDIVVVDSLFNIRVFEVIGKHVERPKDLHFDLIKYCTTEEKGLVSSVTFPLCVQRGVNTITHTLYFKEITPVGTAIGEVVDYFRQRITKEEFNQLQSVCVFQNLEGKIKGDRMNWASCKRNKIIRGYFLGGNVLSRASIEDEELVLEIKDCFLQLK